MIWANKYYRLAVYDAELCTGTAKCQSLCQPTEAEELDEEFSIRFAKACEPVNRHLAQRMCCNQYE